MIEIQIMKNKKDKDINNSFEIDKIINRVKIYKKSAEYDKLINELDKLLSFNSDKMPNYEVLYHKAIACYMLKKNNKHEEYFKKSIDLNPNFIPSYIALCYFYIYRINKFEKGYSLSKRAINLFTSTKIDKKNIGLDIIKDNTENFKFVDSLSFKIGKDMSESDLYDFCISTFYMLLERCCDQLNYVNDLEEYLKKAIRFFPKDPYFYIRFGVFYINRKKNIDKGKECFEEAERVKKDIINNIFYLRNIISSYLSLKEYEISVKYLERLYLLDTKDTDTLYNLCFVYKNLKRTEKLKKYIYELDGLLDGLVIKNSNYDFFFNVGLFFGFVNNSEKALEFFKKCYKIKSNHYSCCYYMGFIYYSMGEYKLSIKYLKEAEKIDYNDYRTYYYLSISFFKIGKYKEAINGLETLKVMYYADGEGYKKYDIDSLLLDCYFHNLEYEKLFNCCERLFILYIDDKDIQDRLLFYYKILEDYCNERRDRLAKRMGVEAD